jgi:hypothetical protein
MGSGTYSVSDRKTRATSMGFHTKSTYEIFDRVDVNVEMDVKNIEIRESRDSDEHPKSVSIVLGLDVTGSMGHIPHFLVKEGLPNIMGRIIQIGIQDPQLLFLGIGDQECDRFPIQSGQFESNDEKLDHWLTNLYLEGGGGGNDGEGYLLAWFMAAFKTSIDCFEKRGQKGLLFTIGDEKCLRTLTDSQLLMVFGNGVYQSYSSSELLDMAREKYHVYHIHMKQGSNGQRQEVIDDWKQILGENLIIVDNKEDIQKIIPELASKHFSSSFETVYVNESVEDEEML